jgi:glycosyltransferase involved in cell wall biosynthesis
MKQVTAIIPVFNEEHNIAQAIESVKWADEILVVDSFSTDHTVQIAKNMGARVIQRTYENSASQKNWAIPQAAFEWIFLLDADERADEKLKKEIQQLLSSPDELSCQAYWIRRVNFFMGRKIRFSGWRGDKVIRFFKRDLCRYEDKRVHAEVVCSGKVGMLKNTLYHNTYKDLSHYLEKWDRYSGWGAADRAEKGVVPGYFHFLVKPAFRFFRDYFLKGGFLDGSAGFAVCALSSMGVFMRYLKVKELNRQKAVHAAEHKPAAA